MKAKYWLKREDVERKENKLNVTMQEKVKVGWDEIKKIFWQGWIWKSWVTAEKGQSFIEFAIE